jgi:hypothetical protein
MPKGILYCPTACTTRGVRYPTDFCVARHGRCLKYLDETMVSHSHHWGLNSMNLIMYILTLRVPHRLLMSNCCDNVLHTLKGYFGHCGICKMHVQGKRAGGGGGNLHLARGLLTFASMPCIPFCTCIRTRESQGEVGPKSSTLQYAGAR